MKAILHIVLLLFLFTACKKVDKKVNAEKPFIVFTADTSGIVRSECFDKIYGKGHAILASCISSETGMELPLSILDSSSTFYFVKNNRTDTLTIFYNKEYRTEEKQYGVLFTPKGIISSFDSVSTTCIPALSSYCNGNQRLFAVIYR